MSGSVAELAAPRSIFASFGASITSVLSRPSRTSNCCRPARSSCEYDFTAPTRFEMRFVVSVSSASNVVALNVVAAHRNAGVERRRTQRRLDRVSHVPSAPTDANAGASSHGASTPCRSSQVRDAVLAVHHRQRVGRRRGQVEELATQAVELDELRRRRWSSWPVLDEVARASRRTWPAALPPPATTPTPGC